MNGNDIKKFREKLGLTQEALARLLNISTQTVNRWEREVYKPSSLALDRIKKLEEEMAKR
jgi:putative transcriptional regulator